MPGDISITDYAVSTANQTTYTFSGRAIGAAASDRYVLVAVAWRHASGLDRSVASATIGGVTATNWTPSAHSVHAGIAILGALVPSGTTADIVITFNSGNSRCGIAVARATGIDYSAAVDTFQVSSEDVSSVTFAVPSDLDTLTDGVVIGYAIKAAGGSTWTISYDGAGGLDEGTQQSIENADIQARVGYANVASGATPRDIDTTFTQGGADEEYGHTIGIVSFGPAAAPASPRFQAVIFG